MAGTLPHPGEKDLFRIVQSIRELFFGRSLAVGEVTLTPNSSTTVVDAVNVGEQSEIFLSPKTANAATATANVRVTAKAPGSFTLTHTNNAQADRTFGYVALG